MKLFCLLISFFFVDVLSENADEFEYKVLVYQTTQMFRRAYFLNNITVGHTSGINGLEYVIERMVNDINNVLGFQDFCKINLLIAVPDQKEIISSIREIPFYDPLQKANYFMQGLINFIHRILGLGLPRYNIYGGTLIAFAKERRDYVVQALKNAIGRRLLEVSEQHVDNPASLLPKCRLLGLYMSTQFPHYYIKEVQVNPTDLTCILTNSIDTKRRYRKIGNIWSEISLDNLNQSLQTVEQQLRIGRPLVAPTS
ncbi:uncharacterized protein LOC126837603 [Adelges cooleyi]|uniref:uncharacterized protein LOC126837603 n=1 Tax=Adelges cooleyi TaxID=133065 RepID=UPI00217FE8E1|nr:uncharacterized protein LOC126837603 [Adelges cooleyi]